MRHVIVELTTCFLMTSQAHGAEVASLAGTWQALWTQTEGTCDTTPGDVTASQWLVSTTPPDAVTVSVKGQTAFPTMTGTWDPTTGVLMLTGTSRTGWTMAWVKVTLDSDGRLTGIRRFLGTKAGYPCFVDGTLAVTR
jgi:hypothetical protein